MECCWKIYGQSDMVFTENIIQFYINLIKKDWIYEIMPVINKYILVENEKIYFGVAENTDNTENSENNKLNIEKTNYFMKKILTHQNILKILNKYVEQLKQHTNDELINENHHYKLKKIFIESFHDKIKATL